MTPRISNCLLGTSWTEATHCGKTVFMFFFFSDSKFFLDIFSNCRKTFKTYKSFPEFEMIFAVKKSGLPQCVLNLEEDDFQFTD